MDRLYPRPRRAKREHPRLNLATWREGRWPRPEGPARGKGCDMLAARLATLATLAQDAGPRGDDIDIASILGYVVVGAVVGVLARLVIPGRDSMGILATITPRDRRRRDRRLARRRRVRGHRWCRLDRIGPRRRRAGADRTVGQEQGLGTDRRRGHAAIARSPAPRSNARTAASTRSGSPTGRGSPFAMVMPSSR